MAKIIENTTIRRTIKLNVDDIINIIKQYQTVTKGCNDTQIVRDILKNSSFYIPEEI